MKTIPPFLKQAGRVLNSGQARTILLTGNINDLFAPANDDQDYVPLLNLLTAQWDLADYLLIVYELNGPIRFVREDDAQKVRDACERVGTLVFLVLERRGSRMDK